MNKNENNKTIWFPSARLWSCWLSQDGVNNNPIPEGLGSARLGSSHSIIVKSQLAQDWHPLQGCSFQCVCCTENKLLSEPSQTVISGWMSSVTTPWHKPNYHLVTRSCCHYLARHFDTWNKHRELQDVVLLKFNAYTGGCVIGVTSSHLSLDFHLQAECLTKTDEFSVCQSESHRLHSISHSTSLAVSLNIAVRARVVRWKLSFTLDRERPEAEVNKPALGCTHSRS